MSKENDMEEAIKKLIVLRKKVNNINNSGFPLRKTAVVFYRTIQIALLITSDAI